MRGGESEISTLTINHQFPKINMNSEGNKPDDKIIETLFRNKVYLLEGKPVGLL
jgi:hypothetical protein